MIKRLIILYLVILCFFSWGYAAIQYRVFPGNLISKMEKIAIDLITKDNSKNQLGNPPLSPTNDRLLEKFRVEGKNSASRKYTVANTNNASLQSTQRYYSEPGKQTGYRLLYGTFDFENQPNGALLVDDNNDIIHSWLLPTTIEVSTEENSSIETIVMKPGESGNNQYELWPHGIDIDPEGSVYLNSYHPKVGLTKLDLCSVPKWNRVGRFHESIEFSPEDQSIWVVTDFDAVNFDASNGLVRQNITMNDIHLANPGVSVFTSRRGLRVGAWHEDPVHLVDATPLSKALAAAFPQFSEGDLLLSYRSLNLVLVIDPDNYKIKWWRTGITSRQGDVDWNEDGTISIYNHNVRENLNVGDKNLLDTHIRYSEIITIDPLTMSTTTIVNGEDNDLYNSNHGKHQRLPNGNILIGSPEQGRFLEVSKQGKVVFEWLNQSQSNQRFLVSEAKWIPESFFNIDFSQTGCHNE